MNTRLLDDAALDRVYVDMVRPLLFEDLPVSVAPELIMVGRQPGAAKTAATVQAVRDLMRHRGGIAYINADELRPFHPHYAALVAADPGKTLFGWAINALQIFARIQRQIQAQRAPCTAVFRVPWGRKRAFENPVLGRSGGAVPARRDSGKRRSGSRQR